MLENVKEKVVGKVTDTLLSRLLRNAGIEDIVNHPEKYKVELEIDRGEIKLCVKRK